MPLPLSGLDALMQGSTIRHFLVAAKNGDAAAQFNLGVLYDSRLMTMAMPSRATEPRP